MARPLRIQYPNAVYHVTCRGNARQDIFRDDADRRRFLLTLVQYLQVYNVKLHAYVFMSNHFHLLVETPLGNLSEFMRTSNIAYTSYYNKQHKRIGHLYQGRYKSILVDKNEYLSILSRYIHLNPIRIKIIEKLPDKKKMSILSHYLWSSLPGYLDKRKRENFVDYQIILSEDGGDNDRARMAYAKALYADLSSGMKVHDKIIGQSVIGGKEFITWITDNFLKGEKERERPSLKKIRNYRAKDSIIKAVEKETGKRVQDIMREKGVLRQIFMELLYRLGGLKGEEIGSLMGVGYTSVSQERKRLRERLRNDQKAVCLLKILEHNCHE